MTLTSRFAEAVLAEMERTYPEAAAYLRQLQAESSERLATAVRDRLGLNGGDARSMIAKFKAAGIDLNLRRIKDGVTTESPVDPYISDLVRTVTGPHAIANEAIAERARSTPEAGRYVADFLEGRFTR